MAKKKDYKVVDNISIEGAQIGFRNFSGKESRFNPPGRKNFCVFFEHEFGKKLEEDGWNIRWLDPREPDEEPTAYLQVAVSFDNIPPKIVLITSRGQNILDSQTVNVLDWADIKHVDLVVRPYNWSVNGKGGVKAYVRSMYVVIDEDEFAHKYSSIPSENNTPTDPYMEDEE